MFEMRESFDIRLTSIAAFYLTDWELRLSPACLRRLARMHSFFESADMADKGLDLTIGQSFSGFHFDFVSVLAPLFDGLEHLVITEFLLHGRIGEIDNAGFFSGRRLATPVFAMA